MDRIKELYRRNQAKIDARFQIVKRKLDKPEWYEFMQRSGPRQCIDHERFVFWTKIIEEGFDENGEYYRRTQLESFRDMSQPNPDLPRPEVFDDMGLEHKKDWAYSMDRADFTERCVVSGNRLLALHMKSAADMQGPYHLRPETIMAWFNRDEDRPICDESDAMTLSKAWTQLGFDAHTVRSTIFGYYDWKGHQEYPGLKRARTTMAKYFEDLAGDMPVLFADEEGQHGIPQRLADEIRESGAPSITAYDEGCFNWVTGGNWYDYDEILYESGLADDEAEPINSAFKDDVGPAEDAVFSAHPLYWGAEGCRHEFLAAINEADMAQLKKFEKLMKRRRNFYGGWSQAKLSYLTPEQKRQVWTYIDSRRDALLAKVEPTPIVAETLARITECDHIDDFQQVVGRTLSHINGRTFNDCWEVIRFRRPSQAEAMLLRTTLNRREKELRRAA